MKKVVMPLLLVLSFLLVPSVQAACTTDADCSTYQCTGTHQQTVCIDAACNAIVYGQDVCEPGFSGMEFGLAAPELGVTNNQTFNVTLWTDQAAACRYSVFFDQNYDAMSAFEKVNAAKTLHTRENYAPALSSVPFYVRCKDTATSTEVAGLFQLVVDPSAPSLTKAAANPSVIAETPLQTVLTVEADEPVVCKFDPEKTAYEEMGSFFKDDAEKNNSRYQTAKSHLLANLVDKQQYSISVACKNRAGLVSPTSAISFSVDTSIEPAIINVSPKNGNITQDKDIVFEVHTNKKSVCWFRNSSDTDAQNKATGTFPTLGTAHKSAPYALHERSHSFQLICSFNDGQDVVRETTNFIIDSTPPSSIVLDDSTSFSGIDPQVTYEKNRLSVRLIGTDAQSGIAQYNYSLWSGSSQLTNWTLTSASTVTLESINLTSGQTYVFKATAQNSIGLWSPVNASKGVKVDITKAPVSCSNGLLDGDETDVDCGGSCAACSLDLRCKVSADCSSSYCPSSGFCRAATCSDGVQNQGETDVDCGGTCTARCDLGGECRTSTDCSSNNCVDSICVKADSCANNKQDEGETDVDCGGICASIKEQTCSRGRGCTLDSDCGDNLVCTVSGICAFSFDQDNDGVRNEEDNCPKDENRDQRDSDGDGAGDACDDDGDNDGISDSWERQNGLDPDDPSDADSDDDRDGLSNKREFVLGTNPQLRDTDGDGASDGKEVDGGTDPLSATSSPGGGLGFIFIIVLVAVLGGGGFFVYTRYKGSVAKLHQEALPDIANMSVPLREPARMTIRPARPAPARRPSGKPRDDVFRAFETSSGRPVRSSAPPPTTNLMDKFHDIPKLSGEALFSELKKEIAEEDKQVRKRK